MMSTRRSSWCFPLCAVLALIGVALYVSVPPPKEENDTLVALDPGSIGAIVDETARATPFTLVEIVNETVFVGRVHGRGLRAHGHSHPHHSGGSSSASRGCKQPRCS